MPVKQTTTNGSPPVVVVPPEGDEELFVAIDWCHTFQRRSITEDEIRREMDRLRGAH